MYSICTNQGFCNRCHSKIGYILELDVAASTIGLFDVGLFSSPVFIAKQNTGHVVLNTVENKQRTCMKSAIINVICRVCCFIDSCISQRFNIHLRVKLPIILRSLNGYAIKPSASSCRASDKSNHDRYRLRSRTWDGERVLYLSILRVGIQF